VARYFAIATVLVVGLVAIAGFWWLHQPRKALTIASVDTTMAPRNDPGQNIDYAPTNRPFIATVPWALSALPECLQQTMSARGSKTYVETKLPIDAELIQPPATLYYADCTIEINATSALVKRGPDRLTIPPKVRFYRDARNQLLVFREAGQTAELRVYVGTR